MDRTEFMQNMLKGSINDFWSAFLTVRRIHDNERRNKFFIKKQKMNFEYGIFVERRFQVFEVNVILISWINGFDEFQT